MDFGQAVTALKQGYKVARKGWNGKGMYLKLIQGYPINGHLNAVTLDEYKNFQFAVPEKNPDGTDNVPSNEPGQMLPHIVMKTAGVSQSWGEGFSDYVPWLASQTDILAEDWEMVE